MHLLRQLFPPLAVRSVGQSVAASSWWFVLGLGCPRPIPRIAVRAVGQSVSAALELISAMVPAETLVDSSLLFTSANEVCSDPVPCLK